MNERKIMTNQFKELTAQKNSDCNETDRVNIY
jgi:hypothetical protein